MGFLNPRILALLPNNRQVDLQEILIGADVTGTYSRKTSLVVDHRTSTGISAASCIYGIALSLQGMRRCRTTIIHKRFEPCSRVLQIAGPGKPTVGAALQVVAGGGAGGTIVMAIKPSSAKVHRVFCKDGILDGQ